MFRLADCQDWVTRPVQENAKSNLFVKSQLMRAVHKSEGFVFASKDPVNRLKIVYFMVSLFLKTPIKTSFSRMFCRKFSISFVQFKGV